MKQNALNQNYQAIDLTNMPDGIYYYHLNTDKAIVGKIVKTSK